MSASPSVVRCVVRRDDELLVEERVDPDPASGFTVYDPETGETDRVCWLHVDDFRKYGETLRPDGLLGDL